MTTVARRVRAIPERSATDAWSAIVNLVAPKESEARKELLAIEGLAATLIASKAPMNAPIVVCGVGPRVRIYCLYDEEALSGDDANEASLATCPTDGDWAMSLPCSPEDLKWVQEALAKRSNRITARHLNEKVEATTSGEGESKASAAIIDEEAFFRP